jgi:hypothetical protein
VTPCSPLQVCSVCSSTVKKEGSRYSQMPVNFYKTTRCHTFKKMVTVHMFRDFKFRPSLFPLMVPITVAARSSPAQTLGIPLEAWMSVCVYSECR